MYAEWVKSRGETLSKRTQIVLEVLIPAFSVSALLAVTAYITAEAVGVIMTNGDDDDEVNVFFLYGFAIANFVIDVVSTVMFYMKRKTVFISNHFTSMQDEATILDMQLDIDVEIDETSSPFADEQSLSNKDRNKSLSKDRRDSVHQYHSKPNLNMLSAFTHVGGDTMRTFAVFIAAIVSSTTTVKSNLADAWAAVVVTITIVICVIPLIAEIGKSARALMC